MEEAARVWKTATARACASEGSLIITAVRIGLNGQWQAIFAPKGEDAYSLLQLMRGGASLSREEAVAQLAPVRRTIGATPAITACTRPLPSPPPSSDPVILFCDTGLMQPPAPLGLCAGNQAQPNSACALAPLTAFRVTRPSVGLPNSSGASVRSTTESTAQRA